MTLQLEPYRPSLARYVSGETTVRFSKPGVRQPARYGNILILLFLAVFLGWGCFVPLDGGAVAPGVVNPTAARRPSSIWRAALSPSCPSVRDKRSRWASHSSSSRAPKRALRTKR